MASRLELAHEDMQRQVEEATAELRARKDEAERATLAKSRFLAAASHDLRQPMHALGLFISELSQHPHQPESRRLVRQIAASAEAMEDLLDSLLDISKLDAGAFKPNLRSFPLQALLDRLAADFTPQADERRLRFRIRPTAAWVESDPALLERILTNLVSNALRYTPEGSVLVACRRRGALVRIEVRDSGVGIAPEAHDIVFQEFVQLENPERARNKGLGLGLAIVRRLIDLLGHRLALRSRVGGGSVFAVELPSASAQLPALADDDERPPGDLAGTRVAVVDDDPLALASLHSLLLSWGCQVYPADSLENIMMELATRGILPQVIISDYRLRGPRTGVDVIRAVRNRVDPDLPAILISGDTATDTLIQAQAEGLVLLHKPVRPAKLRALLNRLLG
jgi:two-component system, sensor histidine kinase